MLLESERIQIIQKNLLHVLIVLHLLHHFLENWHIRNKLILNSFEIFKDGWTFHLILFQLEKGDNDLDFLVWSIFLLYSATTFYNFWKKNSSKISHDNEERRQKEWINFSQEFYLRRPNNLFGFVLLWLHLKGKSWYYKTCFEVSEILWEFFFSIR